MKSKRGIKPPTQTNFISLEKEVDEMQMVASTVILFHDVDFNSILTMCTVQCGPI